MKQDLKGLGTYGTVGLEFSLSVLFGLLGGQWIDKKLGTAPWLTLFGLAVGGAAGIRSLWRAHKAAQLELAREEQAEREARQKYFERSGPEPRAHSDEPPRTPNSS
jgi:ATP synthase protein I